MAPLAFENAAFQTLPSQDYCLSVRLPLILYRPSDFNFHPSAKTGPSS